MAILSIFSAYNEVLDTRCRFCRVMCVPFQRLLEKLAGVGRRVAGNARWCAGNDDFTTTGAAGVGADHPVVDP